MGGRFCCLRQSNPEGSTKGDNPPKKDGNPPFSRARQSNPEGSKEDGNPRTKGDDPRLYLCSVEQPNPDVLKEDKNRLRDVRPCYFPLHHQREENKVPTLTTVRGWTLEEWILNSPAMKHGCTRVGEIQVLKQVCKASPMISSTSSINAQPHLHQSRNMKNVCSDDLSLSTSPSTMRIRSHFSRSRETFSVDRKMRLPHPFPLSADSLSSMEAAEKVEDSFQLDQGGKLVCSKERREGTVLCGSSESTRTLSDAILSDTMSHIDDSFMSQSEALSHLSMGEGVGEGTEGGPVSCLRRSKSENERMITGDGRLVSCLGKSQSEKFGKRVSFRLPEEGDICIFYAEEDEERCSSE